MRGTAPPPEASIPGAWPCWTLAARSVGWGFCLFHVPLEVINEALHLLHGRLVPGEVADALADTFKSSSVAGFLQDIK